MSSSNTISWVCQNRQNEPDTKLAESSIKFAFESYLKSCEDDAQRSDYEAFFVNKISLLQHAYYTFVDAGEPEVNAAASVLASVTMLFGEQKRAVILRCFSILNRYNKEHPRSL